VAAKPANPNASLASISPKNEEVISIFIRKV
jgi:hypothetical protein